MFKEVASSAVQGAEIHSLAKARNLKTATLLRKMKQEAEHLSTPSFVAVGNTALAVEPIINVVAEPVSQPVESIRYLTLVKAIQVRISKPVPVVKQAFKMFSRMTKTIHNADQQMSFAF